MMRRIVATEYSQVCELQQTHKQRTAREAEKRTGEAERNRDGGGAAPPPSHLPEREAPQDKPPAPQLQQNKGLYAPHAQASPRW